MNLRPILLCLVPSLPFLFRVLVGPYHSDLCHFTIETLQPCAACDSPCAVDTFLCLLTPLRRVSLSPHESA